jgi:predicted ATPase/DNA-binding CsgD family transcriptional regulator
VLALDLLAAWPGTADRAARAGWPDLQQSGPRRVPSTVGAWEVLPRPPTSFVGRESELARARDLLDRTRLLTLTGPGGCGKTRLAIEVAGSAAADFPDGVHFVPLASVRDPRLVPMSIARGIGLQDARGKPLLDHLSAYLAERDTLLILDNLEQVLEAGGFIAELLGSTARPRILATSRSPLHVSWEQEFPVPPLRLPGRGSALSAAALAECESVQLFVARAEASVPGFAVTAANASAVAGIAERLDGLPLAIELAAARVKLLPPEAILARLEHSVGLLVSDRRDVPDRQRTLRATIAWSHDLLSEQARRLLAVCSVFRGGVDLAILEAVCADMDGPPAPLLEALAELVDHSLLRRLDTASPSAPRFGMLEAVREFAAERLGTLAGHVRVRAAHASAFSESVDDLGRPPSCPDRTGLDRLELEHDNLRGALDWYRETDPPAALRLANRLIGFWSVRGHFSEGRRRLGALLELVPADDPEWIDAVNGAAWLATDQGDRPSALGLLEQGIEHAHAARDLVREAVGLCYRGRAKLVIGNPAGGRADIERALELQIEAGSAPDLAATLWLAGAAASFDDDWPTAVERFERCTQLSASIGLHAIEARALQLLGVARLELGDLRGAEAALRKAVPAIADLGDRFAIPVGLTALAGLASERGRPRTAFRLAGAAAAFEEVNQTHRPQKIRLELDAWLAPAEQKVGAAAEKLFGEGRALTLDEAIAAGLDDTPEDPWRAGPSPGLTQREQQIAALAATGLTNREIAGRLYLSVRTVEVHVDHVLTKLGFRTRTQLAAWVHEEGLAPRT